MKSLKYLLFSLAAAVTAGSAQAEEACEVREDKICDVRKYSWCGPVDLNFRVTESGERHCQRAVVTLTPTDVLPSLRRIRCYFYGNSTDLRFSADNYRAVRGPKPGDRIPIRNGVGQVVINGEFRTMSEDSSVIFENVGPAGSIIVKCNGYGPA